MNKRYILKNRRRFYIFVMIVIIAVSSVSLVSTVNGADTAEDYTSIVVESGDTLWDLAKEYSGGKDLRQYIRKIEKANNITGSIIYEGDVLKMPV